MKNSLLGPQSIESATEPQWVKMETTGARKPTAFQLTNYIIHAVDVYMKLLDSRRKGTNQDSSVGQALHALDSMWPVAQADSSHETYMSSDI